MRLWILLLVLTAVFCPPARAGEYDFVIPQAEPKPYEIGGRLESRYMYHRLDPHSVRYKLSYYDESPGSDTHEWRALAELTGSYRRGALRAELLTHHEFIVAYPDNRWRNEIYEGYLRWTPGIRLNVEAGKKSIVWGKGYAWNPAGFINRPKDPDDPGLNLEGRTLLGAELVHSVSRGNLSNVALTALLLPVFGDWANPELGEDGDLNYVLKLYLLWRDIDLDFIYFDGSDQPRSFGFDFAKNLAENIAVHGELAFQRKARRTVLDAGGNTAVSWEDQLAYLVGVRYLTAYDTTFILEYYHNGGGYSRSELKDFFAYQEESFRQWQDTGDATIMQRARRVTRPYYQQRHFGKEYFYLKISQKEPFDILYFNPWVAVIVNVQDWSGNLQPGLTWSPRTNWELTFRAGIPVGSSHTEFGERPVAFRPELWARWYF